MASLKEIAREYRDEIMDGIAWVAIWKTGRSWNAKAFWLNLVYAVWYEKYQCYIAIRKLTPKECFRLQGWTDDYFEKAEFVNSDSQLYKQAGNGVTVTVIEAMARKLGQHRKEEQR